MPINEAHPIMEKPKDNEVLWRYMNIPSFFSLLTKNSLTFVRADLFEDKYEGKLPKLTEELLDQQFRNFYSNQKKKIIKISEFLNQNKDVYLNCWCQENHEMVHMWKIYSKEHGIAIETTYEKIKNSIISNETVLPTVIKYLDYNKDTIDWKSNKLTAFTIKRKEYKSENEVRFIIAFPKLIESQLDEPKDEIQNQIKRIKLYEETPAIHCEVNLNELISKVHLSPYAPKWYQELVSDILKKYNLAHVEILKSNL